MLTDTPVIKIKAFFIISALLLVIGALSMSSVINNAGVNILCSVALLVVLIYNYSKKKFTRQAVPLFLFFLSFYDYSAEKGSLWNFIFFVFIVLIPDKQTQKFGISRTKANASYSFSLITVLVVLGIFFVNNADIAEKFTYLFVFVSFIAFFNISANVNFNVSFFSLLTKIIAVIVVMQFLICVNQRFEILHTSFPFFPGQTNPDQVDWDLREEGLGTNKVRNWGSIGDFEAFGEICGMFFVFYLGSTSLKKIKFRELGLSRYVNVIIIFSVLCVLLSGTRSSILMIIIFTLIIVFFNIRSFLNLKTGLIVGIGILSFGFLFNSLGLSTLAERVTASQLDVSSGEGTNRQGPFAMGFRALGKDSYIIGNGYALGSNYAFINNGGSVYTEYIDAHNLYLTLPLYFGWIGSILFVSIFLNCLYKLIKIKAMLSWPFILMWVSFLLNQFKIVFIRHAHYECLIFVLLGLTYAYCKNYKTFDNEIMQFTK